MIVRHEIATPATLPARDDTCKIMRLPRIVAAPLTIKKVEAIPVAIPVLKPVLMGGG